MRSLNLSCVGRKSVGNNFGLAFGPFGDTRFQHPDGLFLRDTIRDVPDQVTSYGFKPLLLF